MIKHIISILFFVFLCSSVYSQSYSYSYVDPCTKKYSSISIPYGQNEVTVNYYGNVRTFNPSEFYNGGFTSWINSISNLNSSSPCDQVRIELTKNLNMIVAQNVINTVVNVASITTLLNASSSLGNAVSNSEQEEKKEKKDGNSNSQSNSSGNTGTNASNSTNTGSTTPQQNSGQSQQTEKKEEQKVTGSTGGNQTTGTQSSPTSTSSSSTTSNNSTSNNQTTQSTVTTPTGGTQSSPAQGNQNSQTPNSDSKNQTSGSGSSSGGTKPDEKKPPIVSQDDKKSSDQNSSTNAISNSISNAEENSEAEGKEKKPGSKAKTGSMIGTGDIVMLRSAEDPNSQNQYRMTASFTRANTTNTRIWGVLGNFTTQINLTNITIYRAWVLPKSQWTIIGANSSMLNFEGDAFNTSTLLASKRFKGNWKKLTAMGGLNYTASKIGEAGFNNLSAVGGGFFSYNVSKKISGSLLCLAVYSPFTHFYEGKWWDSGTLIVPFNSWDYKITKTFKFNVSLSGIYEMKQSVLNYQVLMGGKILL